MWPPRVMRHTYRTNAASFHILSSVSSTSHHGFCLAVLLRITAQGQRRLSKFSVFWDVVPCSHGDDRPDDGSSRHLWNINFNATTRRYIPQDSKLHTRRRENFKSHIVNTVLYAAPKFWDRIRDAELTVDDDMLLLSQVILVANRGASGDKGCIRDGRERRSVGPEDFLFWSGTKHLLRSDHSTSWSCHVCPKIKE